MADQTKSDPASGRNRLVLMPVDPYLMHVYWDMAADSGFTAGARAVVRFHESAGNLTRPFDVDVDAAAKSWYVHLWSADKTYTAELGVRNARGEFVALATSNTVRTGPGSIQQAAPREAPQRQLREVTRPLSVAASAVEPVQVKPVESHPRTELPAPRRVETRVSRDHRPFHGGRNFDLEEIFGMGRAETGPSGVSEEGPVEERIDLALVEELVEKELIDAEMSGFAESSAPFGLAGLAWLDLTEYSEQRFTRGISSRGDGE